MNFIKRSKSFARQTLRLHALIMGACVLGGVSSVMAAADVQSAQPDAVAPKTTAAVSAPDATYQNEVALSLGGTIVSGDKGAFSQRMQVPAGAVFGGVESLHYEDALNKQTLLTLDGRGIVDNHDYKLDLNIANPEVGFFKAGYEEFRTWYDGSGGYFSPSDKWFAPQDEQLALDRGNFSIEAGLTQPNLPVLTLKYERQFRDGKKGSTSWGDTSVKGVTGTTRAIVPSFLDIDETRDIVSGDVKDTFGNTELGLGLRYERDSQNNSRNMERSADSKNERYTTVNDTQDTDIFDAHAYTDTTLSKKYVFTTGYLISSLNSDIGGSRIFGSSYDAVYDPVFSRRQYHDEGYFNLQGGSKEKQYVMNMNLMANPWDDVIIVPSVRIEKQDVSGDSRFQESNVGAAPTFTTAEEDLQVFNDRGFLEVAESLEARYTGIRNWVLYANGDWSQGNGDYSEREVEYETQEEGLHRKTDDRPLTQKYTAGATWYALRSLSLASQYYHKIREDNYDHTLDSNTQSSDEYPAHITDLDFNTDDVNLRVTWRPFNTLTLVSRYDYQLSTVNQTVLDLSGIQSAKQTSQIFSESITWTPVACLYLQGNVNYVLDTTRTPANNGTGAAAYSVVPAQNNYWNVSQIIGYALDQKTDLQVQYSYYRANNYTDNSSASVAYGAGAEEHAVTATLKHDLSERLQASLKYGFAMNRDEASGGNNDYDAHLIMASTKYRF